MFLISDSHFQHLEKRERSYESTSLEQCQQSTANIGAKQCKCEIYIANNMFFVSTKVFFISLSCIIITTCFELCRLSLGDVYF